MVMGVLVSVKSIWSVNFENSKEMEEGFNDWADVPQFVITILSFSTCTEAQPQHDNRYGMTMYCVDLLHISRALSDIEPLCSPVRRAS